VDSREQDILDFRNKEINICALPVGDYSIKNNNYDIYIERKSVNDLVSTFGPKNFNRFRNELIRARESNSYIILLVENDFNTVLGFDHSPFFSKHTKMTSIYLFHQIRTLLQEFPNWQIAFCKNRTDMKEMVLKIFKMGVYWKTHDLQLGIDLKLFSDGI
jgi:ERCC4-type nuclease